MVRVSVLLREVLAGIEPKKDERARTLDAVNDFLRRLNAELKAKKIQAVAVLGGSYAKDTWLSGDYDVDVFVKFDLSQKDRDISGLLERALAKWPFERIHGSRDYFWVRNGIKYEIVPVLDVKKSSDAQNVTDFSPLHVSWVNTKGKAFKGDIRLVKKFCKAAKCYGAESYIRGFSGHVADILVIYYKGFLPLLRAAAKWKPKVVLDYNNAFRGKALLMLNESKTQGPLVLVDPVQPNRNAAAALTEDNFERFVKAAQRFLKAPSLRFFEEKEVDFARLSKKGVLVRVKVDSVEGKEDVAGTKFVRAFEFVRDRLGDFQVVDAGWLWDRRQKGEWWFVLKAARLPELMDWPGPPVKLSDAVNDFRRVYADTFVRQGRVFARVKRPVRTPSDAVRQLIKEKYVLERVQRVVL